jgi:tRNA pseudouridine55 synthase
VDGVLIINKPTGFTSHDVVARVRRILGERSVGHLGTLDPAATGVLPLVIGRFTRLAQFYTEADKRYEGVIRFGFATDTYDAEGEPQAAAQPVSLTLEAVREAAGRYVGHLEQTPPPFSAKKVGGVPAYKLARKNQEVVLAPKQVEVKEFEITEWNGTEARFRAWVSSGTYIRTLAHEMGRQLGPGAHLAQLARTAVREFTLAESHTLEELEAARPDNNSTSDNRYYVNDEDGAGNRADDAPRNGPFERFFLHPRLVLQEFPAVTATEEAVTRIRHGNAANLPEFGKSPLVRVFAGQRHLIAIARRVAGTLFQPKIVLI